MYRFAQQQTGQFFHLCLADIVHHLRTDQTLFPRNQA